MEEDDKEGLARFMDLARTLTAERFAARFPWDFLVVVSSALELTVGYETRNAKPAPATTRTVLEVYPLLKMTSSSASGDTIVIGRSRACDIALSHASVSKTHARVLLQRGKAVTVEDAGSHNGTLVCGVQIDPHVPKSIEYGDPIVFGSVVTVLVDAALLRALLIDTPVE